MPVEVLSGLGAFLSGVGAVLGGLYALKMIRRTMRQECEERFALFKEGMRIGKGEE